MNNATPDANILLQVLLVATFIGNLISIWLGVANRRTIQKREVSITEVPASKREFDDFSAVTNNNFVQVRDEMKKDRQDNERHASQRSKSIFDQIEKVRVELSGHTETVRRELSSEIRDVPDRVISTLKNTGAI